MKQINFILMTLVFLGCTNTSPKNEKVIKKIISIDKPEIDRVIDKRIDLDSILKDDYNNYLAGLKNGFLSLCCYNVIENPMISTSDDDLLNEFRFLKLKIDTIKFDNNPETVKTYFFEDSYFKTHYNTYTDLPRTNIVCGSIKSKKFNFKNNIRIGMDKNEFLEIYFKPTDLFNKIDTISVSENEMGEAETIYIFGENKLKEISFDSSYDWIDKKFKKTTPNT